MINPMLACCVTNPFLICHCGRSICLKCHATPTRMAKFYAEREHYQCLPDVTILKGFAVAKLIKASVKKSRVKRAAKTKTVELERKIVYIIE